MSMYQRRWLLTLPCAKLLLGIIVFPGAQSIFDTGGGFESNSAMLAHETLPATQEASEHTLQVVSFNLEGIGGNQADDEGQQRRQRLREFMQAQCAQPNFGMFADVILTQEDTTDPIADCYEEVVSCASEEYWWDERHRFGDGHRMLNKIYVRKDLKASEYIKVISKNKEGITSPFLQKKLKMNPRCVAAASLVVGGQGVAVASFHLSGGYVDDEVMIKMAKSFHVPKLLLRLREAQLEIIQKFVNQFTGGQKRVVFGGDTNGFPEKQVEPCQGGRIDGIFDTEHEEVAEEDFSGEHPVEDHGDNKIKMEKKEFREYVTAPTTVKNLEGVEILKRVVEQVTTTNSPERDEDFDVPTDPKTICATAKQSTSVWGGQPDAFYTNMESDASAYILPYGIEQRTDGKEKPFQRGLSDHNPVRLVLNWVKADHK